MRLRQVIGTRQGLLEFGARLSEAALPDQDHPRSVRALTS